MAHGLVFSRFLLERPDFLRSHPYLDVLVPLFLHTSVLDGRDCLTSFRRAKQRRCRSGAGHPASHFWGNKRSFVATKVQLAWKILQRRAMPSRGLFCVKITVERGIRAKCTTLFFKERIILTGISRASDCRVYRIGFSSVYVYRGIQLSCNPRCGIGLTLVSSGRLCRFIHPLTIGNIIRLIDNRREKGNTDI